MNLKPLSDPSLAAAFITTVEAAGEVSIRNFRSMAAVLMTRATWERFTDERLPREEIDDWRYIRSKGFTPDEAAQIIIDSRRVR